MEISENQLEGERYIIGGCIQNKEIYYKVLEKGLTSEMFSDARHKLIFQNISEFLNSNKEISVNLLIEFMRLRKTLESAGGEDYLNELTAYMPVHTQVEAYANLIRDCYDGRRFIQVLDKIRNDFDSKPVDSISDYIGQAEKEFLDVTKGRRISNFKTTSEVITALSKKFDDDLAMRQREHISEPYLTGYSTGYEDLDKLTSGFHPADLIILAARPSVGKTAFAINIAQKMAQRHPVAFFSLEMSAELIMMRILQMEADLTSTEIRSIGLNNISGGYSTDMKRTNLSNAINKLKNEQLFIDDTSALKLNDIVSKANKLASQHSDLSLIVIDYLGLITTPINRGNSDSRAQQIGDITRGLKALARDLNVPILVLCQLSRKADDRANKSAKPLLSDLRDSGSIEQDADMVLFITRSDYQGGTSEDNKDQKPQDIDPSRTVVHLSKNRNGQIGELEFSFYKSKSRFEALSKEYYDEGGEDF